MNKLVSIITVSYNSDQSIEETINSILSQTYRKIEYIIIDGASTDNTVSIIKRYQKKASDLGIEYKWVSEPDNGIYDAMNKGLRIASGEIIGILNSDDVYKRNAVNTVIEYLPEDQTCNSIFYGEIQKIDSNGKLLFVSNKGEIKSKKQVCYHMPLSHPATFVGKAVYEQIGFFNTKYILSADYEFIVRAFSSGINFIYINEVLTRMRILGASEKAKNLLIQLKEDYSIKRHFFQELRIPALKKFIADYFKYLIKSFAEYIFGSDRYIIFLKKFYSRK